MKQHGLPITVVLEGGRPIRVGRGTRTERVLRLVDSWIVRSRWWERDERRTYYRLETTAGVIDVYEHEGKWYLSRILD